MTTFDALFEGLTEGLFEIGFRRQAWRFLAIFAIVVFAYVALTGLPRRVTIALRVNWIP